jgi:hypothetical protein
MITITFKLPDQLVDPLKKKSAAWNSASLHRFAKQIVINYLEDTERTRIRHEMADLRREVIRLREDLATATVVLLHKAGKVNDPQEAQEWVERNFLSS